jgi:hypothetical protein
MPKTQSNETNISPNIAEVTEGDLRREAARDFFNKNLAAGYDSAQDVAKARDRYLSPEEILARSQRTADALFDAEQTTEMLIRLKEQGDLLTSVSVGLISDSNLTSEQIRKILEMNDGILPLAARDLAAVAMYNQLPESRLHEFLKDHRLGLALFGIVGMSLLLGACGADYQALNTASAQMTGSSGFPAVPTTNTGAPTISPVPNTMTGTPAAPIVSLPTVTVVSNGGVKITPPAPTATTKPSKGGVTPTPTAVPQRGPAPTETPFVAEVDASKIAENYLKRKTPNDGTNALLKSIDAQKTKANRSTLPEAGALIGKINDDIQKFKGVFGGNPDRIILQGYDDGLISDKIIEIKLDPTFDPKDPNKEKSYVIVNYRVASNKDTSALGQLKALDAFIKSEDSEALATLGLIEAGNLATLVDIYKAIPAGTNPSVLDFKAQVIRNSGLKALREQWRAQMGGNNAYKDALENYMLEILIADRSVKQRPGILMDDEGVAHMIYLAKLMACAPIAKHNDVPNYDEQLASLTKSLEAKYKTFQDIKDIRGLLKNTGKELADELKSLFQNILDQFQP